MRMTFEAVSAWERTGRRRHRIQRFTRLMVLQFEELQKTGHIGPPLPPPQRTEPTWTGKRTRWVDATPADLLPVE